MIRGWVFPTLSRTKVSTPLLEIPPTADLQGRPVEGNGGDRIRGLGLHTHTYIDTHYATTHAHRNTHTHRHRHSHTLTHTYAPSHMHTHNHAHTCLNPTFPTPPWIRTLGAPVRWSHTHERTALCLCVDTCAAVGRDNEWGAVHDGTVGPSPIDSRVRDRGGASGGRARIPHTHAHLSHTTHARTPHTSQHAHLSHTLL